MTDLAELEKTLRELAEARTKSVLDTPRFTFGHVCEVAGVKPARLRNWLNRQPRKITLDADQERDQGKWRYFSGADALQISLVARFSSFGLPLEWADQLATATGAAFRRVLARGPVGAQRNPIFVAQIVDGEPDIAGPFYDGVPDQGLTGEGVEPLGLFFRPLEMCERVMSELGFNVASGTAAELRAKADELEGASDE